MSRRRLQGLLWLSVAGAFVAAAGCGGGSTTTSTSGSGSGTGTTGGSVSNVQPITVNTGPSAAAPINEPYINGAFTSVTVCVPGSTTSCQTIGGILVDTGSSGLRILSSALTISLKQQTAASGSPIVECLPFLDGITWGPVQTTDMTIAGEEAKSLPMQVIGSSNFSTIPGACTSMGATLDDLASLGANGILGVGNFAQDCGTACTLNGAQNPGLYYTCPTTGCEVTTESIANQVQNPVVLFAKDNNGVIVQLPSVTGAETSISGSLIFGIGTESNNALGSATVYTIDLNTGNFTTVFNNVSYTDESFIDSGSNGLFFLDSKITNLPTCSDDASFYCPTTTQNLSATNQGANGASGSVNFAVGNADSLLANESTGVANGLAGPNSGTFDWGLPFFYGRNVYTAIEGQNTPAGAGPYWAY
jgi:Protein of unknown function (DUF3443)